MTQLPPSGIELVPDIPICQTDLPLDWYQDEFKPYAEEYLALPDRTPEHGAAVDGPLHPAGARALRRPRSCCSRTTTWAARS